MSDVMTRLVPAARQALQARRPGVARILLRAARAAGADADEAALLDARCDLDRGDAAGARATLLGRTDNPARRLRAEASLLLRDLDAAVADAADCMISEPGSAADAALLGAALLARGDHADAATCLAQALAVVPGNPALWCQLAQAQPPELAKRTLAEARAHFPAEAGVWTQSVLHEISHGSAAVACALAEAARDAGIADAQILGLLGHARSLLGLHDAATQAYDAALTLAPTDPYVRHLACAGHSRLAEGANRAPPDYVRAVFDGCADRFDGHIAALGYRVPGLVRATALAVGARGPVLDLGCGTGLLAVALSDTALGEWTGVDLSPAMLREAAATGLYAALHEADIEVFLAGSGAVWRTILAGDVFCYLGDLSPALSGIARRLTPDGVCVFSVELAPAGAAAAGAIGAAAVDWVLRGNGRYGHTAAGLRGAVARAGLRVRAMQPEPLRREGLAEVAGLLVTVDRA